MKDSEICGDFYRGIVRGDLELIRSVIASNPSVIELRPGTQTTWLQEAATLGNLNVAELLIELGCQLNISNQDPDKTTPLETAIRVENAEMVQLFLDRGADPNFGDPMLCALSVSDDEIALEIFRLLLEHGAEVNRHYHTEHREYAFTALDQAQSDEISKLLSEHGAKTSAELFSENTSVESTVEDRNGVVVNRTFTEEEIEIGKDLLWAINDNDLPEFQKLCAQHSWLVADTLPGREESILEYVITKRRTGILKYMLQNGFSANPKLKSTETTPLESAIDASESDVVQLLISHGADPNLGRPIIGAINLRSEENTLKFVKLLVENRCDLNRIYDLYGDSANGFTALDFAKGQAAIVEYIRSQGGRSAEEVRKRATSEKGRGVLVNRTFTEDEIEIGKDLRWAIKDGDLAEVKRLCSEYPYLVADTFPDFNDCPCGLAIWKDQLEILVWLLDNGFSPNPTLAISEQQPLEMAVDKKDLRFVLELLKRKANPNLGRPIVGAINLVPEQEALQFVKALVEHGCDLNQIYELFGDKDNGFTALDWSKKKPIIAEYIRSQGGLTAQEVRAGKTSGMSNGKSEAAAKAITPREKPAATDEVIAHFEKTIGPASKKSLIQIVSTGTPVGIHIIPPDSKRKHLTLFTNGLSSKPMNAPEGGEDYRFAELFIELPGDWKVKEVKDMQWAWPLYWLRKMAQYPHASDTWLGGPVTLMANQDPPKPLWPNSKFTALLLVAESSFQRSDGNTVQLYRMIPLYTSERAYELKHGLKRFMQALDQHKVPFVVDVDRQPFV